MNKCQITEIRESIEALHEKVFSCIDPSHFQEGIDDLLIEVCFYLVRAMQPAKQLEGGVE